MNEESLIEHIKNQYELMNRGKMAELDGGWLEGFGFRTQRPRAQVDSGKWAQEHPHFSGSDFASPFDRYEISIEQLDVKLVENVGLAWGFHTESFQMRGQEPEKIRVRFSMTLMHHEGEGWNMLTGHRDAQKFDENGHYIPDQSSDRDGT